MDSSGPWFAFELDPGYVPPGYSLRSFRRSWRRIRSQQQNSTATKTVAPPCTGGDAARLLAVSTIVDVVGGFAVARAAAVVADGLGVAPGAPSPR